MNFLLGNAQQIREEGIAASIESKCQADQRCVVKQSPYK